MASTVSRLEPYRAVMKWTEGLKLPTKLPTNATKLWELLQQRVDFYRRKNDTSVFSRYICKRWLLWWVISLENILVYKLIPWFLFKHQFFIIFFKCICEIWNISENLHESLIQVWKHGGVYLKFRWLQPLTVKTWNSTEKSVFRFPGQRAGHWKHPLQVPARESD